MITAAALALFGLAAWQLGPRGPMRGALAVVLAASLACSAYGLLGQLSRRGPSEPLRFDRAGGAVEVKEQPVLLARATPGRFLVAAALTALAALALRRRRWGIRQRSSAHARPSPAQARRSPMLARPSLARGLVAVALLPYAVTAFAALASAARGFDALWYHLPLAMSFLRSGHLEPPGRDLVFYFPGDGELLGRMLGDVAGVRAMPLVQWPFALVAAAATVALARAVGVRRAAPWAAALVLSSPLVLFQSQLAYVDVIALAALAAGAAWLVRAVRAPGDRAAVHLALVAGLLLGLAAGTKYAALPCLGVGALVVPGFAALLQGVRRAGVVSVAALAGALPPSLFWYARNLRLTGNPIFPIDLPALHFTGLFAPHEFNAGKQHEFVGAGWQWLLHPFTERWSHESGFGPAFAILLTLSLVLSIALVHRRRATLWAMPLVWGLGWAVVWWAATPREPRHLLPLLPLLGAPALLLVDAHRARLELPLACAVAFSSLFGLRTLLFSPAPDTSARPRDAAALYDLPAALTAQIPDGATVANLAGRPLNFALLGPRATWHLVDWSPTAPTDEALRARGVQWIVRRGPSPANGAPPAWRLVYDAPVENLAFWDTTPGDRVSLYRLSR